MTENEKINKLVDDLERLELAHKVDAALFDLDLDWHKERKKYHLDKAAAYAFVRRKIIRMFDLQKTPKPQSAQ